MQRRGERNIGNDTKLELDTTQHGVRCCKDDDGCIERNGLQLKMIDFHYTCSSDSSKCLSSGEKVSGSSTFMVSVIRSISCLSCLHTVKYFALCKDRAVLPLFCVVGRDCGL